MYSASSSESKWSFTQISRSEMREYESDSLRMPVLITFCRKRTMSVYVLSALNCAACLKSVDWNCASDPVRTAADNKNQSCSSSMMRVPPTLHNFKVSAQSLLQHRMPEQASLRNISHQQFHHNEHLMHALIKPRCSLRSRCTADRLLQICVCGGVVQLHGPDASEEVVVSCKLRVSCGSRKGSFSDELVSLVVKIVVKVSA